MKNNSKKCCILSSVILFVILSQTGIAASEINLTNMLNNNSDLFKTSPDSMFIAAVDNPEIIIPVDPSNEDKTDSAVNWHKILGWSTMGMMTVTIASGYIVPDGVHCGLAGATTGLAVATCVNGIYEYGGLISFADGDWHYNLHAILGVLATGGFITTLALADGEGHVATGIASGATFTVALGVIYFQ